MQGPAESAPAEMVHESGRTRITRLVSAGLAQLAEPSRYPGAIMLADAGTANLAAPAKPLAVEDLTRAAAGLARAVAGMHHRAVLHRDITPANIVLSGDGAPCLVDFALATTVAELRPEFTHHSEITGTLAYPAPEATGGPAGR